MAAFRITAVEPVVDDRISSGARRAHRGTAGMGSTARRSFRMRHLGMGKDRMRLPDPPAMCHSARQQRSKNDQQHGDVSHHSLRAQLRYDFVTIAICRASRSSPSSTMHRAISSRASGRSITSLQTGLRRRLNATTPAPHSQYQKAGCPLAFLPVGTHPTDASTSSVGSTNVRVGTSVGSEKPVPKESITAKLRFACRWWTK